MAVWVPVEQSIANHPKAKRLSRALGIRIPEAVGLVILPQHFAIDYAPDGDLSQYEAADLADRVHWEGDAQQLLDTMKAVGFIEQDGRIHNWERYGGKYIEEREQGRERKARSRQRKASKADENYEHVMRDSSVTDGGVSQGASGNPPIDKKPGDTTLPENKRNNLNPPYAKPPHPMSGDNGGEMANGARVNLQDDEEDFFADLPLLGESLGPDEWNGDSGYQTQTAHGHKNGRTSSPTVPANLGNEEPDLVYWTDGDAPESTDENVPEHESWMDEDALDYVPGSDGIDFKCTLDPERVKRWNSMLPGLELACESCPRDAREICRRVVSKGMARRTANRFGSARN